MQLIPKCEPKLQDINRSLSTNEVNCQGGILVAQRGAGFFLRAEHERERGRVKRGDEKPRGRGLGQRNISFSKKHQRCKF